MHTTDLIYREADAHADWIALAQRLDASDPAQRERVREAALHSRTITRLLESQGIRVDPVTLLQEL